MFVVIVEEMNDDTKEVVDQNVFGPFDDYSAAGSYGETKIQAYDGEYSIGWSVTPLQPPR